MTSYLARRRKFGWNVRVKCVDSRSDRTLSYVTCSVCDGRTTSNDVLRSRWQKTEIPVDVLPNYKGEGSPITSFTTPMLYMSIGVVNEVM